MRSLTKVILSVFVISLIGVVANSKVTSKVYVSEEPPSVVGVAMQDEVLNDGSINISSGTFIFKTEFLSVNRALCINENRELSICESAVAIDGSCSCKL